MTSKENKRLDALIGLIAQAVVFLLHLFVMKFGWNVLFVNESWRIIEEPLREMSTVSALVAYVFLTFVGTFFKNPEEDLDD